MAQSPEPAIKSYFFGKGYIDLVNVIKGSWSRNLISSKSYFSKIDSTGEWWVTLSFFLFYGGIGTSVVTFGMAVFVIISIVHVTLLSVFFLLIYICFSILYLLERVYLFFKQFFAVCPHCHKKTPLPEYLCPSCGVPHPNLIPNSFGIFHHRCKCGEKLASSFFLNRGSLQARCSECKQLLDRQHIETRRIFIPILGGASAGKSAFLFSAVRELIDKSSTDYGLNTEFIDSSTESDYKSVEKKLFSGRVPDKTLNTVPKAFNLALTKKKKTRCLLYLYDPAGEAYQNTDSLSSQRYLEYLSGMILIIDPFSITAVKEQYKQKLNSNKTINPSALQVSDALARVLLTMEESFGLSTTSKIKNPLAVVLSKVDAFDLDLKIGRRSIKKIQEKSPHLSYESIRNELIINQLDDWGESGLLQQLNIRFNNIKFFSCSSLTRKSSHAGSGFKSVDVLEPLQWILQTVEPKIFKNKEK